MTQEMRERMAAYAKQKEESLRRDESITESMRWLVTNTIIEHYPNAEVSWVTLEESIFLEVNVRLADNVWAARFDKRFLDAPGFAASSVVSELLYHIEFDPLRQMFNT